MPMEHALLPTAPTLFRCKVRKIPAMFDGTMSLKGFCRSQKKKTVTDQTSHHWVLLWAHR